MIITKQVRMEIRNRRATDAMTNGKKVPGSVPFLIEMLAGLSERNDRDEVLGELAGEYLRAGMEDEHLAVQRDRVANQPNSAAAWLGLAHTLSMRNSGADEAKKAAAKGLEIARGEGALIRYALVCQADVARRVNDPVLFGQSLKELIADASNEREEDCGLSEQLVDGLPSGFCSPELESQYRRVVADGH